MTERVASVCLPARWDHEADVVVVGGGNAGLPAALEARDAGASTLIVEANRFLGGLMRGSGGFMFFCDTHVQERLGVEDRVEWGVEDELAMGEFRAVPSIVHAYVAGGRDTCRWLEDLGLSWADEVRDAGAGGRTRGVARTHFAGRSTRGLYPGGGDAGQCGYALTVVLESAVAARRIPTLLEHRMSRLYRDGDGAVVGLQAQSAGTTVEIRARRGVVLAAGGATSNERLIAAWDPRLVNDAVYSDGLPYMIAMGDALIAGQDVGAGLSDMSFACFTPIRYGTHYYSLSLSTIEGVAGIARTTGVPLSVKRGAYQRIVLVRGEGRRYIDEARAGEVNPRLIRDVGGLPPAEYPEEPFMRTLLGLPNPKNVWAVTDAQGAAAMRWPLDEIAGPRPMHGRGLHPDSVATAPTIEELATSISMRPAILAATLARYNADAATGTDTQFGKPPPLHPLVSSPFYAAKLNVFRHTPSGGLRINSRGQVLDRAAMWDGARALTIDEEPMIPGLYAAGECTAFVGFRRAHRKTGPILTMGRIAGRAAAGA